MYYYLYTHTRPDTNQVFYVGIGRTHNLTKFNRAYDKHKRSKEWFIIYNACEQSIKIDIVKTFTSLEDCCLAEVNLISKYGRVMLNDGCLVNKAPGGHKWKDCMKVYQYDLDGKFIAEWMSPKAAENTLGICYTSIYASCRLGYKAGKYMFKTYKANSIPKWINSKAKSVSQYNLVGKYICTYLSITAAAQAMQGKEINLSQALKYNRQWKHYKWSYSSEYCCVKRLIYQYDLNGIYVNVYSSLTEIKSALNLSSLTAVDNALKGVQKQAYGYIWKSMYNVKVLNDTEKKEIV
jgi:hypothetical protein